MRKSFHRQRKRRISLFVFFGFWAFFLCHPPAVHAQGWSFTAQVKVAGDCGGYVPVIQPITVPSLPTKAQCESLRQSVLQITASGGGCTAYYECTPCTGSDIIYTTDYTAPGSVSIDGALQGSAFFSAHESAAVEDWVNEYMQKLRSMGVLNDVNYQLGIQDIPLTGDVDFDQYYMRMVAAFETNFSSTPYAGTRTAGSSETAAGASAASGTAEEGNASSNDGNTPKPAAGNNSTGNTAGAGQTTYNGDGVEISGNTVGLLTDQAQLQKQMEWMEKNGFNDLRQSSVNNSIDESGNDPAGKSAGESMIRALFGQIPDTKIAIAADLNVNFIDQTMEGLTSVTNDYFSGNEARAIENANNLPGNIVINATSKTLQNAASGLITDGLGKILLKPVAGAEQVYKWATFNVDFWENKTGKSLKDVLP